MGFFQGFAQGIPVGERVYDRYLARKEADAYKKYMDAQKSGDATVTEAAPEWVGGTEQAQLSAGEGKLRLERGLSGGIAPGSGIPGQEQSAAGTGTLRLDRGVSGGMPPGAEIPGQAPRGIDEMSPGTRGQFMETSRATAGGPVSGSQRRAARADLLKAVGARDPSKALMMEEYFDKKDQQDVYDSLMKGAALLEAGDVGGAAKLASHAYSLINDGNEAQLRIMNGQLVGVGFDAKTGKMSSAGAITPEFMREAAMQIQDYGKWKALQIQERQMKLSEAEGRRQEEMHPLQKELAGEQIKGARFENQNASRLLDARLKLLNAQIGAYDATATERYATALYYLAGKGTSAGGHVSGAEALKTMNSINTVAKTMTFKDGSVQAQFTTQHPEILSSLALPVATDIALSNTDASGKTQMHPAEALQAAVTLLAYDALASGDFKAENEQQAREFEAQFQDAQVMEGKDGQQYVTMPINGRQIIVNDNYAPNVVKHLIAVAEETQRREAAAGRGDSEKAKEAESITQILGQQMGRIARNIETARPSEDYMQPPQENLGITIPRAIGRAYDEFSTDFNAGYDQGYGIEP